MKKGLIFFGIIASFSVAVSAQEKWFFTEGTDQTYYDQGIVDVANLGGSIFEHTYPPGLPQYNDKIPCSATAFRGTTSLKLNYTSASSGNWKVNIFRSDWSAVDISQMDSISFYAYASTDIPASALPKIGLRAMNLAGTAEIPSDLYLLSEYNGGLPAGTWSRISFPLNKIMSDGDNSLMNFTAVKAVIFNQSENDNTSRIILIDDISVYRNLDIIPAVSGLTASGYDSHAELSWHNPMADLSYRIYASFDGGNNYELRNEIRDSIYLDFVPASGRNSKVYYRVLTYAQGRESTPVETTATLKDYTDDELLDMVQRYVFRFFWEGAHQATGMALERTDGDGQTVASGATGMGLMAMIVAHEREFRPREDIKDRILLILSFLETCDRHHGAWSHWYYANNGHTKPFSTNDDGGDLVETSYVTQALIALKNYFSGQDAKSLLIRDKADLLWKGVDWSWYRQSGQNVLYWHWSPNYSFNMNMKVTGWSECFVTYIMAASSPTHGIPKEVYTQGWARSGSMVNSRTYYTFPIKLSPDYGGPLFWLHYSHLGINPHNLKDQYADYWTEHVNTVKIHHAYAVENPFSWKNYSDKCWGLTASDDPNGYTAHQPMSNDNGTISPTAALSSMPYAPDEAMKALKYFYRERGADLFGKYGPYDAFNDYRNWVKKEYLGIDQGPIVVMIENYRTALLWNNVMKDTDVQSGLNKLGFQDIQSIVNPVWPEMEDIKIYPNPSTGNVTIYIPDFETPVLIRVFTLNGRLISVKEFTSPTSPLTPDFSDLENGFYIIQISDSRRSAHARLLIQK